MKLNAYRPHPRQNRKLKLSTSSKNRQSFLMKLQTKDESTRKFWSGPGDLACLVDHKRWLVLSQLSKLIFANPFLVGRGRRMLEIFCFSSTFGGLSTPNKKRRSGVLTPPAESPGRWMALLQKKKKLETYILNVVRLSL